MEMYLEKEATMNQMFYVRYFFGPIGLTQTHHTGEEKAILSESAHLAPIPYAYRILNYLQSDRLVQNKSMCPEDSDSKTVRTFKYG